MDTVLFLCHRIPFPPNKGDKIATFNILRYLSKRFKVFCGYFIDDVTDVTYQEDVNALCEGSFAVDISKKSFVFSGLKSLLVNQAITIEQYKNKEMQQWVNTVVANHSITKIVVYSSAMAQFIDADSFVNCTRIVDMADIDSDKWRQYSEKKNVPVNFVYQREHKLLAKFEQKVLSKVDFVGFVTGDESQLFKSMSPIHFQDRIVTIGNGVDTDFFDPAAISERSAEFSLEMDYICFTGAMDYWANIDAILWFVENVWPELHRRNPNLFLYIVGSKPNAKVIGLDGKRNIVVTGRVEDVRPYIKYAQLCIAPLQIARGLQNKVIEAMSMEKVVVMTSLAEEGIKLPSEQKLYVLDEALEQVEAIVDLLRNNDCCVKTGQKNREWIIEHYGWNAALSVFTEIFSVKKAQCDAGGAF